MPNDDRYQQSDSEQETALTIVEALPTDGGIYECVAKNPAGECRCKSRLNMLLTKTGTEAEKGPKQEASSMGEMKFYPLHFLRLLFLSKAHH